ncbi:transposase [Mycobacterium pseudokansasii]|uniref:transposase n=1 Tax=Mycobacterium pseudokansasii TaxID=2341080 RepID=UPI002AA566E3
MRRPPSRPGVAAIPRSGPASPARCGSTMTTTAAARSPTWPPTTYTAPRCSAAASPPPASKGRRLVEQVMTAEPYASADRVFWIVDNGSSHRGQAAIDRLAEQYPNAIMVHTPVHASWLNQIEIYFSIVQRKVVSPNDFTDLDTVIDRLSAFEARYNQTAQPFKWKFTTTDLANLLERLDQHQPSQPANPAQPRAA